MDVWFWPSFIAHCEKSRLGLLGGEFIIVLGCQISQQWHVGTICFSYMHRKWNQLIKHWLDQQKAIAMCALFGFCLTDEIINSRILSSWLTTFSRNNCKLKFIKYGHIWNSRPSTSSRNESKNQCSALRQPWYVTVCKGKQCIGNDLQVRKNEN